MCESASVPRARRYGRAASSSMPCARRLPRRSVLGQRFDDLDDGPVLQERELARPEVVEQRPERFGAQRHLRMELPCRVEIDRAGRRAGAEGLFDTISTRRTCRRWKPLPQGLLDERALVAEMTLSRSDIDSSSKSDPSSGICGHSDFFTVTRLPL